MRQGVEIKWGEIYDRFFVNTVFSFYSREKEEKKKCCSFEGEGRLSFSLETHRIFKKFYVRLRNREGGCWEKMEKFNQTDDRWSSTPLDDLFLSRYAKGPSELANWPLQPCCAAVNFCQGAPRPRALLQRQFLTGTIGCVVRAPTYIRSTD